MVRIAALFASMLAFGGVTAADGHWYAGAGAGITQSYFFGLINDIYATIPAAPTFHFFGGHETQLLRPHVLGWEAALTQTWPAEAREENFTPTFSKEYPAGSTIHYTGVRQTLVAASARYSYEFIPSLFLFAKLGVGARYLAAEIHLSAPDGRSYTAATPSGVMAVVTVAFGAEWDFPHWGRVGLHYQSAPPVVYPVAVGTATVRSADAVLLQWRYLF